MGITLAWEGCMIVGLSNLRSKPSWGGVSQVTALPREEIYLLVSQSGTVYHPSTGTVISEEDAYCVPECPAIYEIRYHIQRGKLFDRWSW